MERVRKNGSCWEWQLALNNAGYGMFSYEGVYTPAHRVSYELYKGEIPYKYEIDHLCRNKRCVNPNHLEAVTRKENQKRNHRGKEYPSHCRRGHEYTKANTRWLGEDKNHISCDACRSYLWYLKRGKVPKVYKPIRGVAF